MIDDLKEATVGTVKEGADQVVGTIKAVKYLIYGIIAVLVIGTGLGAMYIAGLI